MTNHPKGLFKNTNRSKLPQTNEKSKKIIKKYKKYVQIQTEGKTK